MGGREVRPICKKQRKPVAAVVSGPKRMLPIVVAIGTESAILSRLLDSLTLPRHGESSGELGSVMI
jgi:hypothetical protein